MKDKKIKYEKVWDVKCYIYERIDNQWQKEYSVIFNKWVKHPILWYYWFYSINNAYCVFHREIADLYEKQEDLYSNY